MPTLSLPSKSADRRGRCPIARAMKGYEPFQPPRSCRGPTGMQRGRNHRRGMSRPAMPMLLLISKNVVSSTRVPGPERAMRKLTFPDAAT